MPGKNEGGSAWIGPVIFIGRTSDVRTRDEEKACFEGGS